MAPRQTARRLLVAAPALALALAVTACSPPNEQPAEPDAPYTLPTYSDSTTPERATSAEETAPAAGDEAAEPTTVGLPRQGQAAPGQPGEGQEQPAEGQDAPAAPPAQPAP